MIFKNIPTIEDNDSLMKNIYREMKQWLVDDINRKSMRDVLLGPIIHVYESKLNEFIYNDKEIYLGPNSVYHAMTKEKTAEYNKKLNEFYKAEPHACVCDFNTVIMRYGCQCGGK